MDIKRNRREAYQELPDDYPHPPYAQGSAASDQNRFWFVRAQSWSEGADINSYRDVENENNGEHERWGTPYRDVEPVVNRDQHADDPLPNPHNFHSNPGYMGTSTASAAIAARPGPSVYRTPGSGSTSHEGHRPQATGGRPRERVPGRSVVPAGPARQTQSEGAPLSVSTGYPGR